MRGPERRATTASGNAIIRQRPRSRLIYTCIERGTFVQYVYFYIRVWGGRFVLLLLLLLPSSSSLFSFLFDSVILFIFFSAKHFVSYFIHSSDRLCGVHSPRLTERIATNVLLNAPVAHSMNSKYRVVILTATLDVLESCFFFDSTKDVFDFSAIT